MEKLFVIDSCEMCPYFEINENEYAQCKRTNYLLCGFDTARVHFYRPMI